MGTRHSGALISGGGTLRMHGGGVPDSALFQSDQSGAAPSIARVSTPRVSSKRHRLQSRLARHFQAFIRVRPKDGRHFRGVARRYRASHNRRSGQASSRSSSIWATRCSDPRSGFRRSRPFPRPHRAGLHLRGARLRLREAPLLLLRSPPPAASTSRLRAPRSDVGAKRRRGRFSSM